MSILQNSWLGIVIGIILYVRTRVSAPEEERGLSKTFDPAWDEGCQDVKIAWL